MIGHTAQRNQLQRLWSSGKLAHSMMLCGSSGIGKKKAALELCRSLLCEKHTPYGGCGTCHSCKVFDAGNHPDVHAINCADKEEANIEQIRNLLYALNLNSFSGSSRITILDNAEYLSSQAANALLKTFEEPRVNTYFFLITSSASRIPPTLRSRCQVWFFSPLSQQEVCSILASGGVEKQEASALAELADGSLENIEALRGQQERFAELRGMLGRIAAGEHEVAVSLAGAMAKDKDTIRDDLRLLRLLVRSNLREAKSEAERCAWAILLENLLSAEYYLFERNLAAQPTLVTAFLSLTQPAQCANTALLLNRICL